MKKLIIPGLLAAVLLCLAAGRPPVCTVRDGGLIRLYEGTQTQAPDILAEMGIVLGPADGYEDLSCGRERQITVRRLQKITLERPGGKTWLYSYGETVGELLSRSGIRLELSERLCCDRQLPTFDGMVVRTCRETVPPRISTRTLPPEVLRYETASLEPGEEQILCPGSPGLEEVCQTGNLVRIRVLRSRRNRVVLVGTGSRIEPHREPENGQVVNLNGKRIHYSRILHVEATAYTCGSTPGLTAIGTTARVGAIAVDPKLIPYGTRMYILSDDGAYVYGYATAEDCGAFTGHHIDLYFDTEDECWRFGRRACTVYVLA